MGQCSSTKIRSALALAALLLAPGAADASADGAMAAASRGSLTISVSIAPRVEFRSSAAAEAGLQPTSSSRHFCMFSNAAMPTFSVTGEEAGEARIAGNLHPEPLYRIEWRDGAGGSKIMRPGASPTLSAAALRPGEPCGESQAGLFVTLVPSNGGQSRRSALLLLVAPD